MKINISNQSKIKLKQIKKLFETGVQTQFFNDSVEYWSDIETDHIFDVAECDYRCIVDGEIVCELIIELTD